MARRALFVLATRRRYLRRFLSPRNQQNPKRSLEKMKGAEGPGRGGPRSCGGRELAPDRRRPGGERARPWGVLRSLPRGREAGVHSGPPPLAGQLPGVPRPQPPQPPCPSPPPAIALSPVELSSECGFLQSSFEAAPSRRAGDFAPGRGRKGGRVGRGLAPRVRAARRLGPAAPFSRLWRRSAAPEPARGTVGRGAAGSWAQAGACGRGGLVRPLSPAGEL